MKRGIVWEWVNRSGLEHLQLWNFGPDGIKAEGLIVADTPAEIVHLRYSGHWESNWRLRHYGVFAMKRECQKSSRLSCRDDGWTVDDIRRPDLEDCVALDIRGTPFTKNPAHPNHRSCCGRKNVRRVARIDNRRLAVRAVTQTWQRLEDDGEVSTYRCTQEDEALEIALETVDGIVRFSKGRWRRVA